MLFLAQPSPAVQGRVSVNATLAATTAALGQDSPAPCSGVCSAVLWCALGGVMVGGVQLCGSQ